MHVEGEWRGSRYDGTPPDSPSGSACGGPFLSHRKAVATRVWTPFAPSLSLRVRSRYCVMKPNGHHPRGVRAPSGRSGGRRDARRDRPAGLRLLPRVGRAGVRPAAGHPRGAADPRRARAAVDMGLLALAGGEPAGHVAITQAREREEPRPDIPGLAHLWMLFVRPPWWGSGLATRLNAPRRGAGGRARLRGDAPAHARRQRCARGPSTSARAGAPTGGDPGAACSGSTSWSTAAICEDPAPCSADAGQPTHRRSPIAPRR